MMEPAARIVYKPVARSAIKQRGRDGARLSKQTHLWVLGVVRERVAQVFKGLVVFAQTKVQQPDRRQQL
jgi:hypothetical protein